MRVDTINSLPLTRIPPVSVEKFRRVARIGSRDRQNARHAVSKSFQSRQFSLSSRTQYRAISDRNNGRHLNRSESVIGTISRASFIRNRKASASLPRFPKKWRFHLRIKLYASAVEARGLRCLTDGGKARRRRYGRESSVIPMRPSPFLPPA